MITTTEIVAASNARRRLAELNAKFEAGRFLTTTECRARANAAEIVRKYDAKVRKMAGL